jgi:hypothetical protein
MNFKCRHCLEIYDMTEEEYINNHEFCSNCFQYVEGEITKTFYANKIENSEFSYEYDEWFLMTIEYYYLDHMTDYTDSDADSEEYLS